MKNQVPVLRLLLALAAVFFLTGASAAAPAPQPMRHTTITVTTTADELRADGDCSLREAITAANSAEAFDRCPAGSDYTTIQIPEGRYTLRIAGRDDDDNLTGDFDLRANGKLVGAGMSKTIIDANGVDRIFDIHGSTVSIQLLDMTMQNGLVENLASGRNDGGAIYNRGKLTIYRLRVRNNRAMSPALDAFGGGIYNTGTIAATALFLHGNTAQGFGGGLVNQGRVTLRASRVYQNRAGAVAGMLLLPSSITTLRDSRVQWNYASDTWGDTLGNGFRLRENARLLVERSIIGPNGPNNIYSEGTLTFREAYVEHYGNPAIMTIAGGTARISDSRLTGIGGHALHVRGSASVIVERTTAYDLTGAFLHQEGGSVQIINSTITGAAAQEQYRGDAQGILWVTGGRLTLESDTIADNSAGLPTLMAQGGTVTLHNTILARTLGADGAPISCRDVQVDGAAVTNQGYNLFGSICPENNLTLRSTDRAGTEALLDPVLGPLQDNGGKTPTRALLRGTPAINRGDPSAYQSTDQRGVTRPQSTRPDIGAYEVAY